MHRLLRFFASTVVLLALWQATSCANRVFSQDEFPAEQIDFFENRIRPLLATNCLECHGAEKAESNLRLDSRAAILKGGDSEEPGAIVGDPAASLIVKSVKHEGDYEMPPEKKLSDAQINDLSKWIELGLPWPTNAQPLIAAKISMDDLVKEHRQTHWSFQPIVLPPLPMVANKQLVQSPVDAFILSKLEANGISFSEIADRRTLIRRATFDLTGLPPTAEEVEAFAADDSPDAFDRVVDRLLSSPSYGERWGRHWLDVARYADTKGYAFQKDRRYPFAYTYRDYVIRSFNNDLPYDDFVRQQIAADRLDLRDDRQPLAALGFLTVGRKFLGRNEDIDDQVDVVSRGFLGLTVACARCHDHKYDAIPTEDYYSLYGIFDNCVEPGEFPLIGKLDQISLYQGFLDELEKRKQTVAAYADKFHSELQEQARTKVTDYLARVIAPDQESMLQTSPFITLKENEVNSKLVQSWAVYLARARARNPALLPFSELTKLPDEGFAESAAKLIADGAKLPADKMNQLVLQALQANPPKTKIEIAKIYGDLLAEIYAEWKQAGANDHAFQQFKDDKRDLAELLFGPRAPANIPRDKVNDYFNRADRDEYTKLERKIDEHQSTAPEGLSRAMIVVEKENPGNARVMIRGNPGQLGDAVPRRFLAVLSPGERPEFTNGSGRLELANEIASPQNPLTARVIVNRVWMHHFAEPLADSPSDFGIRSDEPLQSDLLNYLARTFIDEGWSIKRLHRTIMLSHAYQQASVDRPECRKIDPENRLLWKMNRRRLEFEALRDSLLKVAGNLDESMCGKSVDIVKAPYNHRRTVYGIVDRQDLPNLFRTFDFASPDQSAAGRPSTIVPQQPLFMMNSQFAIEQAKALASQSAAAESVADRQIESLYRAIFARDPSADELSIAKQFLETALPKSGNAQLSPLERYAQLLLFTNEFEFVD